MERCKCQTCVRMAFVDGLAERFALAPENDEWERVAERLARFPIREDTLLDALRLALVSRDEWRKAAAERGEARRVAEARIRLALRALEGPGDEDDE